MTGLLLSSLAGCRSISGDRVSAPDALAVGPGHRNGHQQTDDARRPTATAPSQQNQPSQIHARFNAHSTVGQTSDPIDRGRIRRRRSPNMLSLSGVPAVVRKELDALVGHGLVVLLALLAALFLAIGIVVRQRATMDVPPRTGVSSRDGPDAGAQTAVVGRNRRRGRSGSSSRRSRWPTARCFWCSPSWFPPCCSRCR